MRLFSRSLLTAWLIVFTLSPEISAAQAIQTSRPEVVGMSSERLQRLQSAFEGYVASGDLPGGVIQVTKNGRTVYLQAFGFRDLESQVAMTRNTLFRIASQTKAVVSVGAMILQEEGVLLLTDPVSDYLPEFASTTVAEPLEGGGYTVVPATRPITIRDLLTHTAGVGYGGGVAADEWREAGITGWYLADRSEPVRETVRRMASLPFEAQPGERWVYGYSTDILGAVLEAASGMPLDEFLEDRIFRPLDMRDTHFFLPESKADRLATVYSLGEDGLTRAPDPGKGVGQGHYVEGPRTNFSGGAGLVSTAKDYTRFLQMLLNGGSLYATQLLSRKSVELMTVNQVGDLYGGEEQSFGLGFRIREKLDNNTLPGSPGMYGWGGAYHSVYWLDPQENMVVTYFTQVIPASGLDDHAKLLTLLYQAIVD